MPAPPTRAESCPATCHMMTDPQPGPIAAQQILSSYLHTRHCRHAVVFPVLHCELAWRSQCVYPQISPLFVLLVLACWPPPPVSPGPHCPIKPLSQLSDNNPPSLRHPSLAMFTFTLPCSSLELKWFLCFGRDIMIVCGI